MSVHKRLSVVIPAYNEGEGIAAALEELIAFVDLEETEIIVVDDGSSDDTAEKVAAFPEVRLIRHGRNRGYGAAIKTGARLSEGEAIAWYDADGQHRPEDLARVVEELWEKDLDYCIGVRGKDSYEDPGRVLGKAILRVFLRVFARQNPTDFNSGLRVFGSCGIVLVLVGAVYGVISAVRWGNGLPVLAAVLILFGLQLFCFGLLSLQISRMRRARFEELDVILLHDAEAAAGRRGLL